MNPEQKIGNPKRENPAEIKRTEYHKEMILIFLAQLNEFYCVIDIYNLMIKGGILRGKSSEEREDVRSLMAAITSTELFYRLEEVASQGLIEVREIRKIDEKDHVEIIVKFYGVKGAILNDGAADNYANFVIKCRNLKYKLTPEESEFMENLVLRIMKEQKIDNYISANRVSKLSIDFTVRIVQNSLDALSEKGEIEKNVNGYIYKRVPKSSQSLPSIS